MDGVEPGESEDAGHDSPLTVDTSPICRPACSTTTPRPGCASKSAPTRTPADDRGAEPGPPRRRCAGRRRGVGSARRPRGYRRHRAALRPQRPTCRSRPANTVHSGRLPRPARIAVAAAGLPPPPRRSGWDRRADHRAGADAEPPTTVEHITVSRPPKMIPLSDQQILALLDRSPDFGPLDDPERRTLLPDGSGLSGDAPSWARARSR